MVFTGILYIIAFLYMACVIRRNVANISQSDQKFGQIVSVNSYRFVIETWQSEIIAFNKLLA
jgi:hypothetical protein